MADTSPSAPPPTDIGHVSIIDEMKSSYLDYAMSVIVARALPDVRDGLKPVHRRILWGALEGGFTAGKPYRKSARIVGDVMGKYHPHGDQSIYDALARMTQDWSMRLPLIDGQGNFGSMDPDAPAAMRYTEARLAKSADALLADIDKDTVDFVPNYDGQEREPSVLPARYPNLLVNGAGGIAVGMATNIPPHNLGEVIDACLALIDNPGLGVDELMAYVPAPDFPTGALILGSAGARAGYHTGRGSVIVRSRHKIEEGRGDRRSIVLTEVPYQQGKNALVEKIAEAVKDKRVEGVCDVRDEIEPRGCARGDRPQARRDAEVDAEPALAPHARAGLVRYEHACTPRRPSRAAGTARHADRVRWLPRRGHHPAFEFELVKARDRAHFLLGLVIAVANLDEVVRHDPRRAQPGRRARGLDGARMADRGDPAYLALVEAGRTAGRRRHLPAERRPGQRDPRPPAQKLTALGREEIGDELKEIAASIAELLAILGDRRNSTRDARRVRRCRAQFATPRRTEIVENVDGIEDEDLIARADMVITVTHDRLYQARAPGDLPRAEARRQRSLGDEHQGGRCRSELFVASTHAPVLFF